MTTLATRDFLQELQDLESRIGDLTLQDFAWPDVQTLIRSSAKVWAPRVDVFTRDGTLVVRADLPGVDPGKDIDVSVRDGMLTIRGERKEESEVKEEKYVRRETSYGAFERAVRLPRGVTEGDIKATYAGGVLEVVIPTTEEKPATKIQVEAGEAKE